MDHCFGRRLIRLIGAAQPHRVRTDRRFSVRRWLKGHRKRRRSRRISRALFRRCFAVVSFFSFLFFSSNLMGVEWGVVWYAARHSRILIGVVFLAE